MAFDPVCGMTVDERTSRRHATHRDRQYYFCSRLCLAEFRANPDRYVDEPVTDPELLRALKSGRGGSRRTFESPEIELRAMRAPVTIALTGALALAMLRAAAFHVHAAGTTIATWAPVPVLPWFTWRTWLFLLVTPVQFIGGWRFYQGSWNEIRTRRIGMEFLIAFGTTVVYLYGAAALFLPSAMPAKVEERGAYFEAPALIIALVLLGRYVEALIRSRSTAAGRRLPDLKPTTARVLCDGSEMEIPAEAVAIGETLIVRPGERIPTDGILTEGSSSVDESMLTGESMLVEKSIDSQVIGGTLNRAGQFRLRATRTGRGTALAQTIRIVEEAQASTAQIQRIAYRVARYFVPAVVLVALLAFLGWWLAGGPVQAVVAFSAVLLVACPSALGVAIRAALMAGVGKCADAGILIRGGDVFERAPGLAIVVFDKTGTLTRGEPGVTDIVTFDGADGDEVLRLAAAVEPASGHPVGEAIIRAARLRGIGVPAVADLLTVSGQGIPGEVLSAEVRLGDRRLFQREGISTSRAEAAMQKLETEGKTALLVAQGGSLVGIIAVADALKPEAKAAIGALRAEGAEVVMLTGDDRHIASAIAAQLGIDQVIADVLPESKLQVIRNLQQGGSAVAMVGDGVKDAPALATADIGIAIGSGSDVAKQTGDIVLIRNDVRDVVTALRLARATMTKIRQNLCWALIYNSVGIPIAALGLLDPVTAAAAMALSSLLVIANSALLRAKRLQPV